MLIGIGTKNPTKIAAVTTGFELVDSAFPDRLKHPFEFKQTETGTSVPDMPLTQQELMQGALERALCTYKKFTDLDFALGLEGGVYKSDTPESAFLQSWVYIYNGHRGYFGSSAALPLPDTIIKALYQDKRELSEVIDHLSGKQDVRSNEGTFGILTRNLITRSQSFETAVVAALTPFFCELYNTEETK